MEELFVESRIEEEKVFDGVVLPKTLRPADPLRASATKLIEGVLKNKEQLNGLLMKHGAILFRGFDVQDGGDFRRVVEIFGLEEMPYLGASPRVKVDDKVYTANEAPLDQFINFHHEMSLMRKYPSRVFFFCLTPPPEGGQTCLARSTILLREMERLQPEFVSKLGRVGMLAELIYPKMSTTQLIVGRNWQSVLGTDDPVEAEKLAKKTMVCNSFEITEDGSAKIIFGPLDVIRTIRGDRLWFNNIASDGQKVSLADGSPIPPEASDAFREALNKICVEVTWKKGDILLVDNLSTQHARRPGKPPRQILVSLSS
ncbi:clavaminate synthase-like protein At3g21360 [Tasmannia lanceolata]|uniref:clavaminate synthase-like protein At3g21360 n=1 Tax=Tasmannia lanceolata TaxID=3420 RepID=UPI004064232E